MAHARVYNLQGEVIGKEELTDTIFGVLVKPHVIQQAIVAQMAQARKVIAHTKDRSEVRGGGRKPWRQKGTGRARHGSIRSPLWRGGGITFGPTKERNFYIKINKKIRKAALRMCLSDKAANEKIYLLENLQLEDEKTKSAKILLERLLLRPAKDTKNERPVEKKSKRIAKVLLVLPRGKKGLIKAFQNLPRVGTIAAQSLNPRDVLHYEYLVVPKESLKEMEDTYGK